MTQRGSVGRFLFFGKIILLFRPIGSTQSRQDVSPLLGVLSSTSFNLILQGYLKTWNHAKAQGTALISF